MSNYRRVWVPGGADFLTVNLLERRRLLVEHVDALRGAFRDAQRACSFEIIVMVALPDHLHCVRQLPEGDSDYSNRWAQIKSGFSRRLRMDEYQSKTRLAKRERGIWQRRFWKQVIADNRNKNTTRSDQASC
jgi:putative transposase